MSTQDFSNLSVGEQFHNINDSEISVETFQENLLIFCELYDENFEVLNEFVQTNNYPNIENILKNVLQLTNNALFVLFVRIFTKLGYHAGLFDSGCVKKLCYLLHPNSSNKDIVFNGTKALSSLSCNARILDLAFGDFLLITLRSKILTTFADDDIICSHILASLVNSLHRNEHNKITFILEGGLTVLYNIPILDEKVLIFQLVIKLLRNLTKIHESKFRAQLMSESFFSFLIQISTAFTDNLDIQENFLWALLNITLNSRNAKGILKRVDGVKRVAFLIRHHTMNEPLQRLALTLFNQISTRTTTRVMVAKEFGMPEVLYLLFAWEGSRNIQLMCLKVIDVMCTLSLCRKRLIEEGRLTHFINWLIENAEDKSFVSGGLNICHKLSISAAETKEALQSKGYPFFSLISSMYADDPDIINITQITHENWSTQADYDNEDSTEEVPSSDSGSEDDDY